MAKPPASRKQNASPGAERSRKSNSKATPPEPATLRAYVMLKPPTSAGKSTPKALTGRGVFVAGPTDHSVVEAVRSVLEKQGFRVSVDSPVAMSIEATHDVFQTVFGTPVQADSRPATAKGLHYRSPKQVWHFRGEPKIPIILQPHVQQVVFPVAAEIHG